ncbi:hypothetical protein L9F63_009173 [Diploptera punctata]|uniref:Uncharacterized protein n=1 Tax=Diploptera punctata TaxID=6984 RepID=A0AAD8E0P3_DIPPU|nr:hypothetical protein L9F63_009173 [Diploptera punctata]
MCLLFKLNYACTTSDSCPAERIGSENPSTYELLKYLTHSDRYSHVPPRGLNISTRLFLYNFQAVHNLRYILNMLLQYRYNDPRLAYSSIDSNISVILGDEEAQHMIWTPHVYIVNDQKSAVMGPITKDITVTILPDGTVFLSQRLKTTLTCWMKLHKFPFDQQQCFLMLESWAHNSNELTLHWEKSNPVLMTPNLHMSEFFISNIWTNSSEKSDFYSADDHNFRFSSSNYSALMVTFQLRRQVGFYIMDYYIPSMLLVFISWVSFWLDANALSGRTALGVSTMLTLILLSSKTSSSLPKVSYILASEIWFLFCVIFIIASLVEFAFVNVIWRRGNSVEMKKVNSKYIFKNTLTPKQAKKEMEEHKIAAERSLSSPPHYVSARNRLPIPFTAQGPAGLLQIPRLLYIHDEELEYEGGHIMRLVSEEDDRPKGKSFTTMTSSQIAKWIDRKSRIMFPLTFLVFNILYWGSVVIDVLVRK